MCQSIAHGRTRIHRNLWQIGNTRLKLSPCPRTLWIFMNFPNPVPFRPPAGFGGSAPSDASINLDRGSPGMGSRHIWLVPHANLAQVVVVDAARNLSWDANLEVARGFRTRSRSGHHGGTFIHDKRRMVLKRLPTFSKHRGPHHGSFADHLRAHRGFPRGCGCGVNAGLGRLIDCQTVPASGIGWRRV